MTDILKAALACLLRKASSWCARLAEALDDEPVKAGGTD